MGRSSEKPSDRLSASNEDELKRSKILLDTTGHMARVGGWEMDANTREVTWTDEMYRLREIPLDHKPSFSDTISFYHPEDRKRVESAVQRALDYGEPYDMEARLITAAGKHRWARTMCAPQIVDGKTVKLLGTVQDITEAKRTEDALRESEDRYRLLWNGTFQGLVIHKDGIVLDCNDSLQRILGYGRDDLLGNNIVEMTVHPDDLEIARSNIAKRHAGPYLIRLIRKDNEVIIVEAESRSLHVRDEEARIVTLQDVTERKRAEDALRQSEKKMSTIFRAAPVGLGIVRDRTIQEVNDYFCAITGYSRDELVGRTTRIVYPTDEEYVEFGEKLRREIERAGIAVQDMRLRRKDGQIVEVLNCSAAFDDPRDPHPGVLFTFLDISDRKRTEEALRKSEQRYRYLVEDINDIIYELDPEGRFTYVNTVAEELTGYKREELVGANIFDFMHEEDRLPMRERILNELSGGLGPNEFRFMKKSGEVMWVRSSSRMVHQEGKPTKLRGVAVDITEAKAMEEQLRQTRKMEALGILAGGIAHEFNNILGIIVLSTELAIDRTPEWSPVRNNLAETRAASLRARNVVQQIMSFARKTTTNRRPARIKTIVEEAMSLSRATIPAYIDIKQTLLCDDEMVLADSTEISQIILNLCNNAVYAMKRETGILEVRLKPVVLDDLSARAYENVTAGAYVKLTVKDNGTGIDPKIMDLVFDPYFTTKNVNEGLGMGLSVVYGIVKKHDGVIHIASKVGEGTTVEVLFPLLEGATEEERPKPEVLSRGSECVLFVDDETSLVSVAKEMLERFGYQVVARTTSPAALEVFRETPERFDLVITDMAMPDMSGARLAQELIHVRPDIPIILCTGHSDRIDEEQAARLGIKAFLMKPIAMVDLTRTIRTVLDQAKTED